MGVLSGTYRPSQSGSAGGFSGDERLASMAGAPLPGFDKLTERNFRIVAELDSVAHLAGRPIAQVALNWLHQKRGVSSITVGATRPEQLQESPGSLDSTLPPELTARLDAVSGPARPFPYYMLAHGHQARIHGQVEVTGKPVGHSVPVTIPAPTA